MRQTIPCRRASCVGTLVACFFLTLLGWSLSDATLAQEPAPATLTESDQNADNEEKVLGFQQSKVVAEMAELEDRMFRLSEALAQLEPESSSRLRLGLKFAREELIQHQMKLARARLDERKLADAVAESKLVLAKLERLQALLLSTDLDFQMRLEQLRQIREILRQLDKAIDEEDREEQLSRKLAGDQRDAAQLQQRMKTLDGLIERQKRHLESGQELATARLSDESRRQISDLAMAQRQTREDTRALVREHGGGQPAIEALDVAQSNMGQAVEALTKEAASAAVPAQEQALAALEQDRQRTLERLERRRQELDSADFRGMKKDQTRNRRLGERITEMSRALGERGAGALTEMVRADGRMSGAEEDLDQSDAMEASDDQRQALESLQYAREQLSEQAEKLLNELRGEVRKRVLEGLTRMLEQQTAIREQTAAWGSRAQAGSKSAQAALIELGQAEEALVSLADELIALVEETEFGIALPAGLKAVRDGLQGVRESLGIPDGSSDVVADERRVEEDLKLLLEAMQRMPSQLPPPGQPRRGQRDRERELNRLVAELKIIRMLQLRLNRDTESVDGGRAAVEELSRQIRDQIESLEVRQEGVLGTTERLIKERMQDE